MQKWEYRAIEFDHAIDNAEFLNGLGAQGWELVSVTYHRSKGYDQDVDNVWTAFFKRPKE